MLRNSILFVLIVSGILFVTTLLFGEPIYIVWSLINTIWLAVLYFINS